MKKRFQILSAFIIIAGLFIACSGQPPVIPPDPSDKEVDQSQLQEPAPEEPSPSDQEVEEPSQPERGSWLTLGTTADIGSFDPAFPTANNDIIYTAQIYESLVSWDPNTGETIPVLAKSWDISEDELSITFTLQDDVFWQNGDPFTADDVEYTFNRILDQEFGKAFDIPIESVEASDPQTFTIYRTEPHAPLLDKIVFTFPIQNRKFVEENGGEVPMGTGPLMLEKWEPGEFIRLKANPDYWQIAADGEPLPYLDGIEFRIYSSDTEMIADFLTGKIDMILPAPLSEVQQLVEDNFDVNGTSLNITGLWINIVEPFDDVYVRQAVPWAIDRDELIENALFSLPRPLYGGISSIWGIQATAEEVYYQQDIDKAKLLLADAGYPDGEGLPKTVIGVAPPPQQPYQELAANKIASDMNEAGFDTEVMVMEFGDLIDAFFNGEISLWYLGIGAFNPDGVYYSYFDTYGSVNYSYHSNPAYDALVEQASKEYDSVIRNGLYEEADQILLNDVPFVFTHSEPFYVALQSYVKGYAQPVKGWYDNLIQIYLEVEEPSEEISSEEIPPEVSEDTLSAIETFILLFNTAFQDGDVEALYNLLDLAVIDMYGTEACQTYLDSVIKNTTQLELVEVKKVGSWNWEIDNQSTPLDNIFNVIVNFTVQDQTSREDFHLSVAEDNTVRWFTDCGEPLTQ